MNSASNSSNIASYAAAWKRYRLYQWVTIILVVLWVPGMTEVGRLLGGWPLGRLLTMVIRFNWLVGAIYFAIKWATWTCPRCGVVFRSRGLWAKRKCRVCGLPKWSCTDETG